MREAEKPLEANLDVAGFKKQVLERIATLEEQEHERKELLDKLVPLMESHGFETGAVKVVLGA